MNAQGEAWEWNIELFGGPLDGLKDTTVTLYEQPPKVLAKCQDVNKKAGQQLIEKLLTKVPDNKRVWIYELRGDQDTFKDGDICYYDYLSVMPFKEFREKYELNKPK
jgi:hypothetical protein